MPNLCQISLSSFGTFCLRSLNWLYIFLDSFNERKIHIVIQSPRSAEKGHIVQNALAIWVKLDTTGSLQIKYFFLQTQPTDVQSGAEIGLGFHAASAEDCANLLPAAAYQRKNMFFLPLSHLYSSAKHRNQESNPLHLNYEISDKASSNVHSFCREGILSLLFMVCSSFYHSLMRCCQGLARCSAVFHSCRRCSCGLARSAFYILSFSIFPITQQDADIIIHYVC